MIDEAVGTEPRVMPAVCWTCLWVRLCAMGLYCDLLGEMRDSEASCDEHIGRESDD